MSFKWTEAAFNKLRELNDQGLNARQIAQVMGTTESSVATQRSKLGLKSKSLVQVITQEVQKVSQELPKKQYWFYLDKSGNYVSKSGDLTNEYGHYCSFELSGYEFWSKYNEVVSTETDIPPEFKRKAIEL